MGNLLVQPLRLPVLPGLLLTCLGCHVSFINILHVYLAKHHACCKPGEFKPLAWLHDPLAAIWQNQGKQARCSSIICIMQPWHSPGRCTLRSSSTQL